ncbi:unnamed protein product [Colias eurytheme]|nr:unnamed protein product [Colias eurytheme]
MFFFDYQRHLYRSVVPDKTVKLELVAKIGECCNREGLWPTGRSDATSRLKINGMPRLRPGTVRGSGGGGDEGARPVPAPARC